MKQRHTETELSSKTRVSLCPTCGQIAHFNFVGEQRWPPRVAEKTGVGPVVHLWMCAHCRTTLTETATG